MTTFISPNWWKTPEIFPVKVEFKDTVLKTSIDFLYKLYCDSDNPVTVNLNGHSIGTFTKEYTFKKPLNVKSIYYSHIHFSEPVTMVGEIVFDNSGLPKDETDIEFLGKDYSIKEGILYSKI